MSTQRTFIIAFILLLGIFATIASVSAQYFPPVPPEPIIVRETSISASYIEPRKTIILNVTQFEPQQVVKKVTLTFKQPVLNVSLTIYHLKEKSLEVSEPPDVSLLYFTIRAHKDLLENVEKAVITFSVEKRIVEEKRVDEKTIVLNRFFEGKWEKLPTRKVAEDGQFLYFEAEAPGLSHFAATGSAIPPFPWWIILIIVIAVVVGVAVWILMKRMKRGKKCGAE